MPKMQAHRRMSRQQDRSRHKNLVSLGRKTSLTKTVGETEDVVQEPDQQSDSDLEQLIWAEGLQWQEPQAQRPTFPHNRRPRIAALKAISVPRSSESLSHLALCWS